MTFRLETYGESHKPLLAATLEADGILGTEKDIGKFWQNFLADPSRIHQAAIVALDRGKAAGVGLVMRRRFGKQEGRFSMIWVSEAQRRRGIGRSLKQAIDEHLAGRGIPLHYAMLLPSQKKDAEPFLLACGFTPHHEDLIVAWNGGDYPYEPVPGVRTLLYRGGDPALDAQIAAFQNRMFRREPMVPELTAEEIDFLLTGAGHWMTVAIEEASGEIVGVAEGTDTSVFSSISVGRRYWGKGVAEWIGGQSLDRYVKAGITNPWTIVRPQNRASLAYLARMNWHEDGRAYTYASSSLSSAGLSSAGAADAPMAAARQG